MKGKGGGVKTELGMGLSARNTNQYTVLTKQRLYRSKQWIIIFPEWPIEEHSGKHFLGPQSTKL